VITCRDDRDWDGLKAGDGYPAWGRLSYRVLSRRTDACSDQDVIDEHLGSWRRASDDDVMSTLQAYGYPPAR